MNPEAIRLNKAIALAGLASRREADALIRRGQVRLNGALVRKPGATMVPGVDELELDGRPVTVPSAVRTELWALYKPKGCVSTLHDPEGRPCLADYLPRGAAGRLFPIGRLDYDAEGLILLTNDGELANRVTHPRYGIVKKYVALVRGGPGHLDIRRLTEGIELEDGPARAIGARVLDRKGDETMVELTLGEGRNREVRRMFEAIGFEVRRLVRTSIGPINDRSLKAGESRRLTAGEITELLASGTGGE